MAYCRQAKIALELPVGRSTESAYGSGITSSSTASGGLLTGRPTHPAGGPSRRQSLPGSLGCHAPRRRSGHNRHPAELPSEAEYPAAAGPKRHRGRLPGMRESSYAVRSLDESTWPAFARLVEANNGVWGGCWCMGFHVRLGKGRTPSGTGPRRSAYATAAPAPRSSSTARTASAGVSSAPRTNCRRSRADDATKRAWWHCRTGASPASSPARGCAAGALRTWRWAGRCSRSPAWAADGRGLPGGRRLGARRVPVQRRAVDLRAPRVQPRPQDRQAPLGRDPDGQSAHAVGSLRTPLRKVRTARIRS